MEPRESALRRRMGVAMHAVSAALLSKSGASPSLVALAVRALGRALGVSMAAGFAWYVVFLVQFKLRQRRKRLPWLPGPTPLPVVGSLHLVAEKFDFNGNPLVHLALMNMGKRYDGVFGLYLGASYTVVVTDPGVAEEAFGTWPMASGYEPRGVATSDRAPLQSRGGHHVPTMFIMTRDGKGIAMSTGAYWAKVRGRLVKHITSPNAARKQELIVRQEVESVVAELLRKARRGEKADTLRGELKRESMNMAMSALFSRRFGSGKSQDFEDLQFCVEFFFCNLSAGNPSDMIPSLRVLPNKLLREFKRVAALRDRVLGGLISAERAKFDALRASGAIAVTSDCQNMCQRFMWDQDEGFEVTGEDGAVSRQYLSEDEITVCMWDIVFAMTDTTATTNEWLIYYMVNNPDVQAKVHAELDRELGGRLPTLADKDRLPYLWAVIKEVMRIKLASPVMAPHYAKDDMTLHDRAGKEFFVPAGATVFMHGYSMALDPALWDEPERFDPERWFAPRNAGLDLVGQVKRTPTEHYKFMPFSIGPRMCPGYNFAKVAQFLQTATLMHSFEWRLAPDASKLAPELLRRGGALDLSEAWGLTIQPRTYGEMGLVQAVPRPPAARARAQPGDLDLTLRFLQRERRGAVRLVAKEPLSHDSALLRFALPDRRMVLGLPCGQHFKLFMPNLAGAAPRQWNGREDPEADKNEVVRSYTPTSADEDAGFVDLVVKFYRPGQLARCPDGGKVSQQLDLLVLGDEVEVQGPFGLVTFLGDSRFKVGKKTVKRTMVGLLAAGSGITPVLQILRRALADPEDQTLLSLVYANQTEADILLRPELEELKAEHPERFRLHYTLDRPPDDWQFDSGFVTSQMLKTHMPPPSDDALVLICGPPPFVNFACKDNLAKLGYAKDAQVAF